MIDMEDCTDGKDKTMPAREAPDFAGIYPTQEPSITETSASAAAPAPEGDVPMLHVGEPLPAPCELVGLGKIGVLPGQPKDPMEWCKYEIPAPVQGQALANHESPEYQPSSYDRGCTIELAINVANSCTFKGAAAAAYNVYSANPKNQSAAILLSLIYDHDPAALVAGAGITEPPGIDARPTTEIINDMRWFLFGIAPPGMPQRRHRKSFDKNGLAPSVFGDLIKVVWLTKIERKIDEAVRLLSLSLMRFRHPSAALLLHSSENYQFCWPLLKYAAVWGNTRARVMYARVVRDYGDFLVTGHNLPVPVPMDEVNAARQEALDIIVQASKSGSKNALIELADWTSQARCGLCPDPVQYMRYVARFLEYGFAKTALGTALLTGRGVRQDVATGRAWLASVSDEEPQASMALADSYYYPIASATSVLPGAHYIESIDIERAAKLYFAVATAPVSQSYHCYVVDACRKLASLILRGACPGLENSHAVGFLLKGCTAGDPISGLLYSRCVEMGWVPLVREDKRRACAESMRKNASLALSKEDVAGAKAGKYTPEALSAWVDQWFMIATKQKIDPHLVRGRQLILPSQSKLVALTELTSAGDPTENIPLNDGTVYTPGIPKYRITVPLAETVTVPPADVPITDAAAAAAPAVAPQPN